METPMVAMKDPDSEEKVIWGSLMASKPLSEAWAPESILNVDPDWSRLSTQEASQGFSTTSTPLTSLGTAETHTALREAVQAPPTVNEEDGPRDMAVAAEAEIRRVRKTVQEEEAHLSSDAWRDISKPSAKVFFKTKQKPARDCLWIAIDSESQAASLPVLETKDGKIVCGAIPTCMAVPHYPQWFPFCDSSRVLKEFSDGCFIQHVKLKVLFIHLDFVLLVNVADCLREDQACVEVAVTSPPPGSEGGEWLGVQLPPKPGALPRITVRHAMIRLRPTSRQSFHIEWQIEVDDVSGAPQWMKVFAIQQIATRLVPELAKVQPKIPGSPMDRYLNGQSDDCITEGNLKLIYDLDKSITCYMDRVEAARERDGS